MPLHLSATGSVAPVSTTTKPVTKPVRRKPIFLNIRSSNNFIFTTAAVGLFTSTFVHSILFPLAPFIVNRVLHGDNVHLEDDHPSSSRVATSQETGILVALYAVGLLVGSPIFGWLGDRIKQRRVPMLLGIVASIAANFMFIFSVAYWMLLLARFLQGISNACVWTLSLCLVADNWPEEKLGLQMGKLVGFYPLGIITGLPIGVLYNKVGYQAPFIASMILCGIDFFMRLVIIERCHSPKEWFEKPPDQEKPAEREDTEVDDPPEKKQAPEKVTILQLLKRPCLLVSLHITIVVATVMSSYESVLSLRLAEEWHFDEAACGLILLAFMLPYIASSAASGYFCDKYGPKIVAVISVFLVIPVCISLGVPNRTMPFWPLIPILTVGGIAMAGCQAPVFPEIARVVSEENKDSTEKDGMATSYALFNAAYGTGVCLGPFLSGFMYASVGFFWLCFTLGMLFVVSVPFVYIYIGKSKS